MTPQLSTDPTIVDSTSTLDLLVEDLSSADAIAVDTEANSFFAYRERICLVQISTRDRDYLVDPLAPLDLRPLGGVFADPAILKVFHAAENDIILLRQAFDFTFRNLFDTLVAAQVIGVKRYSLQAMLQERFSLDIDKELQRSNWGQRPLSVEQIRYAALDTHFLLPLRDSLASDLESKGRFEEAASDFIALESKTAERREFDPNDCVRIKGSRELSPVSLQVLRELFALRDRLASERDVPPFRILMDFALLHLARRMPRDASALRTLPGVGERVTKEFGEAILEAIARGRAAGPLVLRPPARTGERLPFDPRRVELYDRLRDWRARTAEARGVESFRVAKNELLSAVVKEWPTSLEGLSRVPGMENWRVRTYGEAILNEIRRFGSNGGG